ncbi:MAG TPA: hypothetical protein VN893_04645 [Bryobacteraceae bacterium]|nr:hypothetical protein [Bryobacteraceae bacterium]
MTKLVGLVVTCLVVPFVSPASLGGQEIPAGIRYEKASDADNAAAISALNEALRDTAIVPTRLLNSPVTCGPMLWQDLRPSAEVALLRSKVVDFVLETPDVIHVEGRAMTTNDQREAFWAALVTKYRTLKGSKVRKANAEEIRYYWATIPFDIREPLLTIDTGANRFVVNFTVENGVPHLFWLDRVDDLRTLKGDRSGAKDADTAAADLVEQSALPEGWKRYRFAYDGGQVLSFVMASEPKAYAEELKAASHEPITMTGRTLSANASGISFNALYGSRLSRTADRLSDAEKTDVFSAITGGFLSGLTGAIKQAGGTVDLKPGKSRIITISGFQGWEQDLSIPPLELRARIVLVDSYAYGALVAWKPGASQALVDTFLNSLRVER